MLPIQGPSPLHHVNIYSCFNVQLITISIALSLTGNLPSSSSPSPSQGLGASSSMSIPPLPPQEPLPPLPSTRHKSSLYKQKSWSPDILRDELWMRRQANARRRHRSKSLTDEDVDELKACFELGFSFDSPEMDHHLSDTFPAYELYYYSVVNKQYNNNNNNNGSVSKRLSDSSPVSSNMSEDDSTSPPGSPHSIVSPGDNPQTVKTKLKQWAQVVACSVRQF